MKWNGQPFLVIAVAFAMGIILNKELPFITGLSVIGYLLAAVFSLLKVFKSKLSGLTIPTISLLLGFGSSEISNVQSQDLIHLKYHTSWGGYINSAIADKGKYYQAVVEAEYYLDSLGTLIPCKGKVMVNFTKDSLAHLEYGEGYQFLGKIDTIQAHLNPGGFNYKAYLTNKYIYAKFYAKAYQPISLKGGNPILMWALKARIYCAEALEKVLTTPESKAVGLGLTLGIKDYIDAETTRYFQDTGTLHALAVSGAHLQIIFMVLGFSLQRFKKPKTQRFYLITVLIGIWAFAFITGWCASVLRAAIMYTVFLIGQSKGYYKLSWNQLGFSAFLLLLIDPNYLYDVGFQLSYAAIAGIAIASQFWPTDALTINKAYRYFLNTIIATIGATMGTAIISAFYFHQFPVWFLPANLVAVPITAILLPLTLLSIPLTFVSEFLPWLSLTLNIFYNLLIGAMQGIASLPFAIVNHIYFDAWQCLGLNLVGALFLSYYLKPERTIGILLASSGILLTLYSCWQTWKFNQVEEVIIWHNPKAVLITYRQSGVTTALGTDSLDSYTQHSLTNYAEGNFQFKKLKSDFKLKIKDCCFHYNTAPCDSNCYTITTSANRKVGLENKNILVYKYPQANFQGYQTAKSGSYKVKLTDL